MPKLPALAAAALCGLAFAPTSASALPLGAAPLDAPALVEEAGWAQSMERGGQRFLRTTNRYAPRRDVTSTGNVKHPSRPANQAGWGEMPGGPRRYGVR
jgi:hypothetical protein